MHNDNQVNQVVDLFLQGYTIILFMKDHKTYSCKYKFMPLSDFRKLLRNADKARAIPSN